MTDELRRLLIERAADLEDTEIIDVGTGTVEFRLDDRLFATVQDSRATFHLRADVADAALRTPDVTADPRGGGWIAFVPAALDDFARDRALAWLQSAWRLADESMAGPSTNGDRPAG